MELCSSQRGLISIGATLDFTGNTETRSRAQIIRLGGGEGLLQQPVCGLLAPRWQFVESAFQTSAVADEGNGVNGLKEDLGVSKYTLLLRR